MIAQRLLRILLILIFITLPLPAKKILDHDAYDIWLNFSAKGLNADGSVLWFSASPDEKDGFLQLIDTKTEEKISIDRGDSLSFSHDGHFAAFLKRPPKDDVKKAKEEKTDIPRDSLRIFYRETMDLMKFGEVKHYALPEENSDFLAWLEIMPDDTARADSLKKPANTDLVLYNISGRDSLHLKYAVECAFSEDGRYLAYEKVGPDSLRDGLYLFNTRDQELRALQTGFGEYLSLTFDKSSNYLAWLSAHKENENDSSVYMLNVYDLEHNRKHRTIRSEDLPEGPNKYISKNKALKFSENGERLLFGLSPYLQDMDWLEENEDSLAKEINVQIWHWQDPYLMTQQLVDRKKELKRAYDALLELKRGRILTPADEMIPEIAYDENMESRYALGRSNIPYRQRISWDWPPFYDIYRIDLKKGTEDKIHSEIQYDARISPGGDFAIWWDSEKLAWCSYDLKRESEYDLTSRLQVAFHDEDHDWAFKPLPYADPQWTENDEYVYLQDRYDIWRIKPDDPASAQNITKIGRSRNIDFDLIRLDKEHKYFNTTEDLYLSAFNRNDKKSGFFKLEKHSGDLSELIYGAKSYRGLSKAENSELFLFSREDFTEFPDLRITDGNFSESNKMTELNPQRSEYNWGTAEIMTWTSLDGREIQGILYKPEDFDEENTYPLMVYFYEKNSHNLYRHRHPAAHRSIINFPFYTSRGYCIFVPDIPYKVGYPGESALNAVLPGVTLLADKPWIEKDRIAVQGHSWGGYQIAYLVTQTDIFHAAEAGAPVSNMFSAYGGIRWQTGLSRMFQYERTQSRIGGTIWEMHQRYIENSPIFMADKINTPLLIMHNDNDGHVPWTQGIELFVALRRLQKPAWMINYSGEPHWPLSFEKRKDWAIRMQQYFDHYLKDTPPAPWIENGLPAVDNRNTLAR